MLLELQSISKSFGIKKKSRVLDDVNIKVEKGWILGLIGETGHGKTTIARIITGVIAPDSGQVFFNGKLLQRLSKRSFDECARIQYVFQDPYSALDENATIKQTLAETVKLCKRHNWKEYVTPEECLDFVKLGSAPPWMNRRVFSLSGGQRQRLILARALIPKPELLIADESTSMLDITSGIKIASLFSQINQKWDTTVIVISHQTDVIKTVCTHIAVIYEGKVLDYGTLDYIFHHSDKPYTKKLVNAMNMFSGGF